MINEERYHKMIDQVEDYAILLMDEKGIIQNWNKGAEKIKGYKAEEVIGKSFQIFYLKEDQEQRLPQRLIKLAEETGKAIHEGWRVRKNGSTFWGSIVLTALHDGEGKVIGFTKVTRDLTERKLVEEQLKDNIQELDRKNKELQLQKEFIETVIDASVDVIAVLDKDLKYIMINKKTGDMYGEDIIGRPILECFPVIETTSMYTNIKKAFQGEAVHDLNYRSELTKRYSENFYIPIKDNTGSVKEVLMIGHDITDVREANHKLEKVIEELKKTNQELEQFAFVSSHDLQEPLRKIQTFSDMLLNSIDNPGVDPKLYLQKIHSSANRMSALINDLLNFSRLNKMDNQPVPIDLNEVLENIKSDFEVLIEQKQAIVHADHLPVIHGVRIQLNQLFYNLMSNALKFSKTAPTITISFAEKNGDEIKEAFPDADVRKKYAYLSFKDNGIGFEHIYASKIFTIFQRLNDRESYSGTGIGLAVCKKIVENLGGVITARGEVNVGAQFDIYLPLP